MRHDQEFSDLFTARFDWARRVAYALCGDWKEAEEIAQNAFVRVYGQWSRVRRDSAEAYLRTVLTRVFLDGKRRWRARESVVAEVPEPALTFQDSNLGERELLIRALHEVPHRQRAVLVLRYLHDLSVDETARVMNCSTGTVKSQTNRGLRALREAYHTANDPEVLDAR